MRRLAPQLARSAYPDLYMVDDPGHGTRMQVDMNGNRVDSVTVFEGAVANILDPFF